MYTIYHEDFVPEALNTRYPNPARYGEDKKLCLFGDSLESLTGTPADVIVDIAKGGLNEPFDEYSEGMTGAELITLVTDMQAQTPTGKEIEISKAQGRYLYSTIFKPETTEL